MKKYLNIFLLIIVINNLLLCQTAPIIIKGNSTQDNTSLQIYIDDGIIYRIDSLESTITNNNYFVAPGFIDIQINGYMGVDFTGPDLSVESIKVIVESLYKVGVTSFLPTIITNDKKRIIENFKILAESLNDSDLSKSIPGFHLEGPYISPIKGFRGAHLEKYIRDPNWSEFVEFQNAANGNIKLITVAPELNGSIDFIKKLANSEVIVSLGHHNGTYEQIENAIFAGASLSTHLGNGCANEINRHNNPIWPQLSNDKLSISIIADGFHLNKEELRTFYKVKGNEKTILISDALDLAGLKPGEYIRGERKVLLTENVIKFPEENVLAGAASPISKGIENIIKLTDCKLSEAIRMASENPAKLLGLNSIGKIEVGKRADIILFSFTNNKIEIQKTFVAGKLVYSKL